MSAALMQAVVLKSKAEAAVGPTLVCWLDRNFVASLEKLGDEMLQTFLASMMLSILEFES
jgi:hypothetical protein